MPRTLAVLGSLPFVFALAACDSPSAMSGADAGAPLPTDAGPPGDAGPTPTWYGDVAHVAFRECVSCHQDGGAAPFALTTYEMAQPFAGAMAAAVAERRMPPMPVSNAGDCMTYSNARWLSEAEIAMIGAWAAGGAPAGDPALGPELPGPPPSLDAPDVVLDFGSDYVPDTSVTDDYRCFVIDPGLSAPSFLTAYEVVPGEARVVHHVIVYEPSDEAAAADVRAADAADPRMGYPCFGGIGASSEPRVLWAPGVGMTRMPAGTGVPIAAGRPLVVQIHYNTLAGPLPDRTTVRLQLASTVDTPAGYVPILDARMRLMPRMEHVETSATFPLRTPAARVYGVLPHMHTLGRTLRVTADTASGEQCLVDVDRWDFNWQGAWWYDEPLDLRDLSAITITCGYDTRERSDVVTWGDATSDEMCLNYLYVAM